MIWMITLFQWMMPLLLRESLEYCDIKNSTVMFSGSTTGYNSSEPLKTAVMHTFIQTQAYCIHSSAKLQPHFHTVRRTYIHTYIHTYVHTYLHTCIHTYIHTKIHTYINTYIHTYIHT